MSHGEISSQQAVALVTIASIGTATLIVPSIVTETAGRDGWAAIVAASLVTMVPGFLWVRVMQRLPGHDLYQLTVARTGRVVGTLMNLVLLLWATLLAAVSAWWGGDLVITSILPNTPFHVLVGSLVLPAAFAAYQGLEVVARIGQLAFWSLVILFAALIPLSSRDIELHRLLPVLGDGTAPVLRGMVEPIGLLAQNMVLAAILPFLSRSRSGGRLLVAVTAVAGGCLTILTIWTTAVFGPTLPAVFRHPVLMIAQIISIADIVERLDSIMVIVWIEWAVVQSATWYWLACQGIARMLRLQDYRPVVFPMALVVTCLGIGWYRDPTEVGPGLQAWTLLTVSLIGIAMPLLLLGMGALRKAGNREERQE